MRTVILSACLVSFGAAFLASGQTPKDHDFLTTDEANQIREIQEPNARMTLYLHFAKQRLDQVEQLISKNKAGRAVFIHDLLQDYTRILDAIGDVSDDALRHNTDLTKGDKDLETNSTEMLAQLQKIEDAAPRDLERYSFVLMDAITATSDSLEASRVSPAVHAAQAAAEQKKQEDERLADLPPEERAAEKKKSDEAAEKKRNAPSLLRPGESLPDSAARPTTR
jgi:hypothetical protein